MLKNWKLTGNYYTLRAKHSKLTHYVRRCQTLDGFALKFKTEGETKRANELVQQIASSDEAMNEVRKLSEAIKELSAKTPESISATIEPYDDQS